MNEADVKQALDLVDDIQSTRAPKLKLDNVPKILLPYQAAWHADDARIRIAEKSRRIGFSWGALAAEAVLEAAETKGMSQYYMGFNLEMAATFIGDCAFFCNAYNLAASAIDVSMEKQIIENDRRDILTYQIKMASGHKIKALASSDYALRSKQGHVRYDEFAFMKNGEEKIKAALALLMWGGRLDIVSTHDGEENIFNQYLAEVKASKLPWSHHRVTFDEALRQGLYRRICLVQGKIWSQQAEDAWRTEIYDGYPAMEDAQEEMDCIPKRGSGAYFSRLLLEQCMQKDIPIIRWAKPADFVTDTNRLDEARKWIADNLKPVIDQLPPDQRSVYGQDFGRSGDLSVTWVLQKDQPQHWHTGFILELRNIPFDVQALIRDYILENLPLLHHAKFDSRGNGQSHAEAAQQKFGASRVDCVMATPKWYAEYFPKYRQAYEDKSITVPHSEDIIADHRMVQLVKGQPQMAAGRTKGSDGGQRHGDSTIAGLNAWAAALEESEPSEGISIEADPNLYGSRSRHTLGLKAPRSIRKTL